MFFLIFYFLGFALIEFKALAEIATNPDFERIPYITLRATIVPWIWPALFWTQEGRYILSVSFPFIKRK